MLLPTKVYLSCSIEVVKICIKLRKVCESFAGMESINIDVKDKNIKVMEIQMLDSMNWRCYVQRIYAMIFVQEGKTYTSLTLITKVTKS